MDNGNRRFKKCKQAKMLCESSQMKEEEYATGTTVPTLVPAAVYALLSLKPSEVSCSDTNEVEAIPPLPPRDDSFDNVAQIQSSDQQTTASELEYYKAQLEYYKAQVEYYKAACKNSVLKKGHANPTTDELNFVRDHMRQFNSSEQEFFSMFQNYFDDNNPKFATKFKYMLNNGGDDLIEWMRDSLIPFGKQLLNWCDGGSDNTLDQSLYCCNGMVVFCKYLFFNKLSNAINSGKYVLSTHSIFRDKTVTLIKEYVLQKFPPNPAPYKTKKIKASRKRRPRPPLWHEYNPLRELGYLKANENENSSARNDPSSCAKGN
jgi:hypothetical protein